MVMNKTSINGVQLVEFASIVPFDPSLDVYGVNSNHTTRLASWA